LKDLKFKKAKVEAVEQKLELLEDSMMSTEAREELKLQRLRRAIDAV